MRLLHVSGGASEVAVSVIIACRNGGDLLRAQVAALAGQVCDREWELVLADNGSTDGSVHRAAAVRGSWSDLRVVDASTRRGQSYARNAGVRSSRSPALLFLDQDDLVAPGYLSAMARALDDAVVAGARMEFAELNPQWLGPRAGGFQQEGPATTVNNIRYLPYFSGCSLGIRRSLFDAVGGFDVTLGGRGGCEDIDLCWKVQDLGARLRFVPDAVLHYRFPSSVLANFHHERGYARQEVTLYKRYLARGLPPLTWGAHYAAWREVLRAARGAAGRDGRVRLSLHLAHRLGRLQGSVAERVLCL